MGDWRITSPFRVCVRHLSWPSRILARIRNAIFLVTQQDRRNCAHGIQYYQHRQQYHYTLPAEPICLGLVREVCFLLGRYNIFLPDFHLLLRSRAQGQNNCRVGYVVRAEGSSEEFCEDTGPPNGGTRGEGGRVKLSDAEAGWSLCQTDCMTRGVPEAL